MSSKEHHTQLIKNEASRLDFDFCGIAKAEFLEEEAPRLERWLMNGYHGQMKYMETYFDKRLDPRKLVEGARSVISLLYNYYPAPHSPSTDKETSNYKDSNSSLAKSYIEDNTPLWGAGGPLSKYAYGKDYHLVVKEKLKQLLNFIQTEIGDINGRAFVDSAPVLDRAWAQRSGLGWIGKNSNLINKQQGSFFFIAELIIDLELSYDSPIQDYCGTCTACIDACPTGAIIAPYIVDGSKCISYFTIELKEQIPSEMKGKFDGWALGCDTCQDVCPWNRFSRPHHEPEFLPKNELQTMTKHEWMEMTEDVFEKLFKDSAVKRTGYKGLKRNLLFLEQNSQA